jgi:RNA polymerase sigma-70 factor (family 1)
MTVTQRKTSESKVLTPVQPISVADDFESLFHKWYAPLCRYACTLVEPHEAEEVVQAVFVRLWERRDEVEFNYSAKAYLYRMVHNYSLNHLRSKRTRKAEPIESAQEMRAVPSEAQEEHELQRRLQSALLKLPTECRRIFELSRFEELKYREIADQLQISIKTVETQMGKALRIMRTELSDMLVVLLTVCAPIFSNLKDLF